MTDNTVGVVAPHESCEVRLVLGGHKPLAAIEKAKDAIGYALAIALAGTGALKLVQLTGEVIVVKPNKYHLIEEYLWLLTCGVAEHGLKEYHRRIGRLFGYTEEDIEAFIKADIHCDCHKCKGN